MKTSHRRMQTNVNECRQMLTSVDESKIFYLIPEKVTMVPFCCYCNYVTAGHISMQIFNFVVLSVIIAPHSVLTFHISKPHLPIRTRKSSVFRHFSRSGCFIQGREALPTWGVGAQLPLQNL